MNKFLIIISLFFLIFSSCKKSSLDNLSETIFVRNKGADIPAYIRGNGTNKTFIILIHGGPGGNGLMYRAGKYAEMLEEKYAVVYTDQRGQGMSQGKYNLTDITIDQMAEDLYTLVLVLKNNYGKDINIYMFGHSWGGTLGTAFMLHKDYQKEVKGWIESDGAHDMPILNKEALRMFKELGNEQIIVGNSTEDWQKIVDWANTIDTANISIENGGEINAKAWEAEKLLKDDSIINESSFDIKLSDFYTPTNGVTSFVTGRITSAFLYNEIEKTAYTNQLYKIEIPCLFLWGKYDIIVPSRLGYDAYENVSSTEKKLVIFEKSGHSPLDTEAELFANEIIDFIEKVNDL